MKKKFAIIILAIICVMSLCFATACGKIENNSNSSSQQGITSSVDNSTIVSTNDSTTSSVSVSTNDSTTSSVSVSTSESESQSVKDTMYTITFCQQGMADIVKMVNSGESLLDIPSAKEIDGYDVSWDKNDFTNITSNIVVKVKKTPISYSITYVTGEINSTTTNPKTYNIESDDIILKGVDFSFGNTFGGWYLSEDYREETRITKISKGTFGDLKLYAKSIKYKIESANDFEIDYTKEIPTISKTVSNTTLNIDLADKFTISDGCSWSLYSDFAGFNKYPLKAMNLEIGYNEAYVIVMHPNQDNFTRYLLKIYRLSIKRYTFYNGLVKYDEGTIEESQTVLAPETNPTKDGYNFDGWKKYDVNTNTAIGEVVSFPYKVEGDIAFCSTFKPKTYSITYNLYGGTNSEDNPKTFTINDLPLNLDKAKATESCFYGWYLENTYNTKITQITNIGDINLFAKYGDNSEGLQFTISSDGTYYSVSGYSGTDNEVYIGNNYNGKPVLGIGPNAFVDKSEIVKISIPNSIKYIGASAFDNCSGLGYNEFDNAFYLGNKLNPYLVLIKEKYTGITSCSISNTTKIIHCNAFKNCNQLTSITIPNSVEIINENAFSNCNGITSVIIPKSIESIGSNAFVQCENFENVFYFGNIISRYEIIGSIDADWYYYSESTPNDSGEYWHYQNGVPVKWDTNSLVGFELKFDNAHSSYFVDNYDGVTKNIVIPDTYNGMPITIINDCVFERKTQSNAIFFCIDFSTGMNGGQVSPDFNVMERLQASIKLAISQGVISSDDQVGIIIFGGKDEPQTILELTDGSHIVTLMQALDTLVTLDYMGNTEWRHPQEIAAQKLQVANATSKHIIFITDAANDMEEETSKLSGYPNGGWKVYNSKADGTDGDTSKTYAGYLKDNYGITMSTMLVCRSNEQFINDLKWMAKDGGGNFYNPMDAESVSKAIYDECSYLNENSSSELDETGLKSITLGKNITSIGNYAFSMCNNLSEINVLGTITHIGRNAFSGCTNLPQNKVPKVSSEDDDPTSDVPYTPYIYGGTYTVQVIDTTSLSINAQITANLINGLGTITASNYSAKLLTIKYIKEDYSNLIASDQLLVVNYDSLLEAEKCCNAFIKSISDQAIAKLKTKVELIKSFQVDQTYKDNINACETILDYIDEQYYDTIANEINLFYAGQFAVLCSTLPDSADDLRLSHVDAVNELTKMLEKAPLIANQSGITSIMSKYNTLNSKIESSLVQYSYIVNDTNNDGIVSAEEVSVNKSNTNKTDKNNFFTLEYTGSNSDSEVLYGDFLNNGVSISRIVKGKISFIAPCSGKLVVVCSSSSTETYHIKLDGEIIESQENSFVTTKIVEIPKAGNVIVCTERAGRERIYAISFSFADLPV